MMKKWMFAIACLGLGSALTGVASAQQAVQDLQFMLQGGSYLGIGVRDLDTTRAQALKMKEERGVEVTSVEAGSPAEAAGVKVGDVVVEFAGEQVNSISQFVRVVRETPGGRKVKMTVWRNGGNTSLTATVGTRKSSVASLPRIEIPAMPSIPVVPDLPNAVTSWRVSSLGVDAEAIDGQLARYFGVAEGVLIRSVNANSPAEKAGLKAGDVITKVGSAEVGTPRAISKLLREQDGKQAQVTAVREHKEINVNVMVSAEQSRGGGKFNSRLEIIAQ